MDIASLLSDSAQRFILDHQNHNLPQLMLSQRGIPGVSLRELVQQIKARTIIRDKIPSWHGIHGLVYGAMKSLEQCSSEQTAVYKSQLIFGDQSLDLTGGLGVDSYFVGKNFNKVIYVEKDAMLCRLAEHNFGVLKAEHIEVIQGDAQQVLEQLTGPYDLIYLDPDRRPENFRRFKLEECQPALPDMLPLLWAKTNRVMIKLSPMLDIYNASSVLNNVKQVHVVSVRNDCKELVIILERDFKGPIQYFAVNFTSKGHVQSFSYKEGEDHNQPSYSEPMEYLYEPNSSIMKLGAFKSIGTRYELNKLHPNSHLYTSDKFIQGFPGRSFEVQWTSSYLPNELRKLLPSGKANITVRNFVKDVKSIRKDCKLKEGGDDYLFATTGPEGHPIVINAHRC